MRVPLPHCQDCREEAATLRLSDPKDSAPPELRRVLRLCNECAWRKHRLSYASEYHVPDLLREPFIVHPEEEGDPLYSLAARLSKDARSRGALDLVVEVFEEFARVVYLDPRGHLLGERLRLPLRAAPGLNAWLYRISQASRKTE